MITRAERDDLARDGIAAHEAALIADVEEVGTSPSTVGVVRATLLSSSVDEASTSDGLASNLDSAVSE